MKIPTETSGILECIIATMVFFAPNFLFLFPFLQDKFWFFFIYNWVVIYLLISSLAHTRFKG